MSSNLLIFCILILSLFLLNCATTNYYTAQTLEQGQTALTPGVDNLLWIVDDEGVVEKNLYFSPSFGIATGLPFRLETGIRVYPYILEANLRHQINPRSFKCFDTSINGHMGVIFGDRYKSVLGPYYKYGLTLSKKIGIIQPFISYYFNKNWAFLNESDEAADYSVICFGIAFQHKQDLIIPEFNYYENDDGKGILCFGIGVRALLIKKKSDDG